MVGLAGATVVFGGAVDIGVGAIVVDESVNVAAGVELTKAGIVAVGAFVVGAGAELVNRGSIVEFWVSESVKRNC